jgi:hypothetical protein
MFAAKMSFSFRAWAASLIASMSRIPKGAGVGLSYQFVTCAIISP